MRKRFNEAKKNPKETDTLLKIWFNASALTAVCAIGGFMYANNKYTEFYNDLKDPQKVEQKCEEAYRVHFDKLTLEHQRNPQKYKDDCASWSLNYPAPEDHSGLYVAKLSIPVTLFSAVVSGFAWFGHRRQHPELSKPKEPSQ